MRLSNWAFASFRETKRRVFSVASGTTCLAVHQRLPTNFDVSAARRARIAISLSLMTASNNLAFLRAVSQQIGVGEVVHVVQIEMPVRINVVPEHQGSPVGRAQTASIPRLTRPLLAGRGLKIKVTDKAMASWQDFLAKRINAGVD
jgi:hypothetical protein